MAKRSFKEMIQGMTFREKVEYLWEYYRWTLLVAAFGVIVIAMVVTGVVNSQIKILYSGAAVNVPISQTGEAFLTDSWGEKLGAGKKEEVRLFSTSFEDLQTTSDAQVSAAAAMQVVLMITAGDYDYVIMDEVALDFYKNHPVFSSLDSMFSAEILDEYKNRVFCHETEETGEFPLAIDITDSGFARAYVAPNTKVYIAFPGNTGRTEINDDFLEYLMKQE